MTAPPRADTPPPAASGVRVGIDLVRVDDVRDALRAHGQRYLDRVYTPREVDDCGGPDAAAERLAARFAAKEAVLKVLRPAGEAVPWSDIEVRRDPGGWVDVELRGSAAALAGTRSVAHVSVSLTHEGDYASAVALGQIAVAA
jgi:holo-[acyl-carrier protein] synthase